MVKVIYSEEQKKAQWVERVALERHHEGYMPSQRYKESRSVAFKLNPVVPQDVDRVGAPLSDFPPHFLELNAPRQRPPVLGNPLFGYSCHPIVAPVPDYKAPIDPKSRKAAARLAELQELLDAEREKRLRIGEDVLAAAGRR